MSNPTDPKRTVPYAPIGSDFGTFQPVVSGTADVPPGLAAPSKMLALSIEHKPFAANEDHPKLHKSDEVEHVYLDKATAKDEISHIAAKTGAAKLGATKDSLIIVTLFVVTLMAAAIMPITVTWAKGGGREYPFLVSWWMVCFKGLVVVISYAMATMAGASSKAPEAAAPLPLPLAALSTDGFKFGLGLLPPAMLYTICDLLAFPILLHTDSATYATLTQLKIVVVALLFKFALGRQVWVMQWVAIVQLTLGALLYKVDVFEAMVSGGGSSTDSWGVMLILLKVVLASLASVWCDWSFHRKGPNCLTFPQQQIYFAFWMFFISILNFCYDGLGKVMAGEASLFGGWDIASVVALVVFASYGILVSLFIKYLDSLTKLIMNLLAILVTAVLSVKLFGNVITTIQYFAILFIITAAMVFKLAKKAKKKRE